MDGDVLGWFYIGNFLEWSCPIFKVKKEKRIKLINSFLNALVRDGSLLLLSMLGFCGRNAGLEL